LGLLIDPFEEVPLKIRAHRAVLIEAFGMVVHIRPMRA